MTPDQFHESAALWLVGVAVARRLYLPMSWGRVYPNLMVVWIAPTTLFHKSTALEIARSLALPVPLSLNGPGDHVRSLPVGSGRPGAFRAGCFAPARPIALAAEAQLRGPAGLDLR